MTVARPQEDGWQLVQNKRGAHKPTSTEAYVANKEPSNKGVSTTAQDPENVSQQEATKGNKEPQEACRAVEPEPEVSARMN